jgi:anti-sigma factor (TIGR02949 family)
MSDNDNNKSSDSHQCLQSLIEVFLYLDGQLDPKREDEISSHLQHCQECYGRIEFERLIKGYVKKRSNTDEASEDMVSTVKNMLR